MGSPVPWQGIGREGFALTASNSSCMAGFVVYAIRDTTAIPEHAYNMSVS